MKPTIQTLVLISILALITGCVGKRSDATSPLSGRAGSSTDGTAQVVPAEDTLSKLVLGVGVRDFNQLNQGMAVATGIDPRNNSAKNTFNTVSASLPGDNDLKRLSGPNMVAIARLASQYCDLAAANGSPTQATLFPGVNFGNATAISDSVRDGVITALLTRFNQEATPNPDDVLAMQQLFNELKAGGANKLGLMVSLCTAALGSVKGVLSI